MHCLMNVQNLYVVGHVHVYLSYLDGFEIGLNLDIDLDK